MWMPNANVYLRTGATDGLNASGDAIRRNWVDRWATAEGAPFAARIVIVEFVAFSV